MRPEEAVALRASDTALLEVEVEVELELELEVEARDQWGELTVHAAEPEVGRRWTGTGTTHERRGLKGRDERGTRSVPCHPALTRILRDHIAAECLRPGDR